MQWRPASLIALLAGWTVCSCTPLTPPDPTGRPEGPAIAQAPPASARPPERAAPPSGSAATATATEAEPPAPPAPSPCPEDMVAIVGQHCTNLQQRCLKRRKPWQCAQYEAPAVCPEGALVAKEYCIDRYEHPNRQGALPTVMSSFNDARRICAELGKRLCTEAEWTLACEGPERLAFPYGHVRDATACPIDKPSPRVNEERLFYRGTQAAELARLDQREPSGSRPRCVSAYGVYDLTGNVDEWVLNETGQPHQSSLKGGNWGEYRNACRPVTRGHSEGFRYYQTGFRCCRDLRRAE